MEEAEKGKSIRLFERNARVVDKVHHIMDEEIVGLLGSILDELKKMNKTVKPATKPAGKPAGRAKKVD